MSDGSRSDEIEEFEDSEDPGELWKEQDDTGFDLEEDEFQFLDQVSELATLQSGKFHHDDLARIEKPDGLSWPEPALQLGTTNCRALRGPRHAR